jgi:hypothetical protein
MMIVFSVVTLCAVMTGGCFDLHVPHPEHTIETCEAIMRQNAPVAVQVYNDQAASDKKVKLGGYRCQEEPNRPSYTSRR